MAPKYEQLVMALRQTLPQWYADGQRKLPCEQELAAQFSVSRQTLRQALAVLEQEGLIEKRRGSGSFLCPAAANQDRRIAVIATSLSDYIFPSLLKDIQACLSVQGFSVVIHATENSIHREREILQQLLLVRCITAVADNAAQTHATAHSKALNALGDVVGSIQAHQLAGRNNIYIGCIALADRHGKAAAYYVT